MSNLKKPKKPKKGVRGAGTGRSGGLGGIARRATPPRKGCGMLRTCEPARRHNFSECSVTGEAWTMKQDVIAPWAEVVPDAPFPMTIAQMQALPDDNWQYELVDGRLVRMPGSGSKASRIAMYLG